MKRRLSFLISFPFFVLCYQGKILNASCCPDSPFVFCFGGEKQGLRTFDITESAPGNNWLRFILKQSVNLSPSVSCLIGETDILISQTVRDSNNGAFPFNQNLRFEFPATSSSAFNSIFLREVYPNFRNFFLEVSFPFNLTHNTPEFYP